MYGNFYPASSPSNVFEKYKPFSNFNFNPNPTQSSQRKNTEYVFYGVDVGSRNINITKLTLDNKGEIKTDVVTDFSGKREIFNGMQYVAHIGKNNSNNPELNPKVKYDKRRLGNSCVRSKPYVSMKWDESIEDCHNSTQQNAKIFYINDDPEKEFNVSYYLSECAIFSLIKELIVKDAISAKLSLSDISVVFAFNSSFNPLKVNMMSVMIREFFDKDFIKTSFMLSEYALCISHFNAKQYNFFQGVSDTVEEIQRQKNTAYTFDMIVDASHSQTSITVVGYHKLSNTHNICVTSRKAYPVSGQVLEDILVDKVITELKKNNAFNTYTKSDLAMYIFPGCSIIEKIKLDLSMYEDVLASIDIGDITTHIKINRNLIELPAESELRFGIMELINRYGINCIEVSGGFSRSFVIKDIINDISKQTPNIIIKKALTSDDSVSRGAAFFLLGKRYADDLIENNNFTQKIKSNVINIERWFNTIQRYSTKNNNSDSVQTSDIFIDNVGKQLNKSNNMIDKKSIDFDNIYLFGKDNKQVSKKINGNDVIDVEDIIVDATNDSIFINHNGIDYSIRIGKPVKNIFELSSNQRFHVGLYFNDLDMLVIKYVKETSYDNKEYNVEYVFSGPTDTYSFKQCILKFISVEDTFSKYSNLHGRIGDIFNKMDEFYFDVIGYDAKKKSLKEEINRMKSSYTYIQGEVERLEKEYKTLIDAYEFCRIVAIEPELLDSEDYPRDPEAAQDNRLTRETANSIILKEEGLAAIEAMMNNF